MEARPQTSQPRGPCKYFTTPRGCFAGNNCKFLHGDDATLTPYDANKTCRFYASGFCKRGANCWFRHTNPRRQFKESASESDDDYDDKCSICMETPALYGLLTDCSHIYCHACLKSWRDPHQISDDIVDSGVHKQCPMCRVPSRFVIPSSVFYKSGDPMKEVVIERYKQSMKRVACRYFENSPPNSRWCPFGKDCFYKHVDENGEEFVFDRGVDHYMRMSRRYPYRNFPHRLNVHVTGPETTDAELGVREPVVPTLPSNNVPNQVAPEVFTLVETLLREVSNFAHTEESTNPAVAAQLNALVNRMLDLQIGGPETDAEGEEDVGSRVDDGDNEDTPPLQPIEGGVTGEAQGEDSFRHADDLSVQPEDSASVTEGVTEDECITHRSKFGEVIRANWEDDSDEEHTAPSPRCVPLPCSPLRSHQRAPSFSLGHTRQRSSISSQLALANPPQLSSLDEPENPQRSELIRCAILNDPPESHISLATSPPLPVLNAMKCKEFIFEDEYEDEDEDMEDLVRSVQRTLLGQNKD